MAVAQARPSQALSASNYPEPLFTLAVAVEMIPMPSISALYVFLARYKAEFPGRYRKTRWYEVRLLSQSEILRIREMTTHGFAKSRYSSPNHGGRGGPIAAIMRRAMGE